MSGPSFHFLDPLNQIPGTELPTLLGRFVLDRWNPVGQDYAPPDPSKVITPETLSEDLDFSNAKMYITTISNASTNAGARKALIVGGSLTNEGGVLLSSAQVMKRGIKNVRSAFEALMGDPDVAADVQRLMRDGGAHRVWMITAVLFASNTHVITNTSRDVEGKAQVQVQVPSAAVGGIPGIDFAVAEMSASLQKKSEAALEADLTGLRVFAVQYWRCEHPHFLSRLRGQMTLRGRGLQKVDTGHKGLGDSDEEDGESECDDWETKRLVIQAEERPDDFLPPEPDSHSH